MSPHYYNHTKETQWVHITIIIYIQYTSLKALMSRIFHIIIPSTCSGNHMTYLARVSTRPGSLTWSLMPKTQLKLNEGHCVGIILWVLVIQYIVKAKKDTHCLTQFICLHKDSAICNVQSEVSYRISQMTMTGALVADVLSVFLPFLDPHKSSENRQCEKKNCLPIVL